MLLKARLPLPQTTSYGLNDSINVLYRCSSSSSFRTPLFLSSIFESDVSCFIFLGSCSEYCWLKLRLRSRKSSNFLLLMELFICNRTGWLMVEGIILNKGFCVDALKIVISCLRFFVNKMFELWTIPGWFILWDSVFTSRNRILKKSSKLNFWKQTRQYYIEYIKTVLGATYLSHAFPCCSKKGRVLKRVVPKIAISPTRWNFFLPRNESQRYDLLAFRGFWLEDSAYRFKTLRQLRANAMERYHLWKIILWLSESGLRFGTRRNNNWYSCCLIPMHICKNFTHRLRERN